MITIKTAFPPHLTNEQFENYKEGKLGVLKNVNKCAAAVTAGAQWKDYNDSLGWMNLEKWADKERIAELKALADEIRADADVLVLVGVGGSNQAARAVIEALKAAKPGCEIIYAGNNLSAHYYLNVLEKIKDKSVYINVIAKNFETLEPGLGFRLFIDFLNNKYGTGAGKRVIATGTKGSSFHKIAIEEGYHFLAFPDDIGGRFSVFSDVGLFPMLVAGIDAQRVANGAYEIAGALYGDSTKTNAAFQYAAYRNFLLENDYTLEILSSFEPQMFYFGKWWTQLFAESEGKENKGLYPVSLAYSEDLHSVGQYVQEGLRNLIETFLIFRNPNAKLNVKPVGLNDGFDYLNGKDLWEINKVAEAATIKAHADSGVPMCIIESETISEEVFGMLFFFFEYSCYISAEILKVNPFNQPGVEGYKKYMFDGLGKPQA